ncbi:MAG: hypothetical protein E6J20_18425 [Chloroflexi bacterium]|nr:MAG: hypothetical protein E6J20_18425 [Chloroflexota bacterium]
MQRDDLRLSAARDAASPPRDEDDSVRAVGRVLQQQAAVLDQLALEHAHAKKEDWRALLEGAYNLQLLVRLLPGCASLGQTDGFKVREARPLIERIDASRGMPRARP